MTEQRARKRLLLLNPNTSESVTARIAQAAAAVASPSTELVSLTATRGVPYIAARAEAVIGGAVALEMLAEHHAKVDAAVIAAFGDPGLGGARELFPIPVVGLAEAGMLTACMLGRNFALVTFSAALEPWYRECVAWHGLEKRCAGVFALSEAFNDIGEVQDEKAQGLLALATDAVGRGADVIVLSGAPLAGLAAALRNQVSVPLVDCVAAAVKQAEALLALAPCKPRLGTFRRPDPKPTRDLPPALAAWIEHREQEDLIG
jgi:allantoin racemase